MPVKLPLLLIAAASLTLSACISPVLQRGNSAEWDGVWSGRMTLSIGEKTCPRRTPLTADISNGAVDGNSKFENLAAKFVGYLDEAGQLNNGELQMSKSYYNFDMSGSFDGEKASGVWQNRRCKGKWEMRRVRKG